MLPPLNGKWNIKPWSFLRLKTNLLVEGSCSLKETTSLHTRALKLASPTASNVGNSWISAVHQPIMLIPLWFPSLTDQFANFLGRSIYDWPISTHINTSQSIWTHIKATLTKNQAPLSHTNTILLYLPLIRSACSWINDLRPPASSSNRFCQLRHVVAVGMAQGRHLAAERHCSRHYQWM